MSRIAENVADIQRRIHAAANGRSVQLVAVSKTFPAESIREAYDAGVRTFGENRIQEAIPKMHSTGDLAVAWHFIGHLQTNKARDAVRNFPWIQSIDSIRLLEQVEKEAAKQNKNVDLLLEMNLGGEETKYGFTEGDLSSALVIAEKLQFCRVRGLMIIPPFQEDPEQTRPYFKKLAEMRKAHPQLTELSMGMSHDFEVAIQEGATMVRIGTALFGTR